ncbi:MAG: drug/metabolite exporter [Actinomycetota bacterium]
MTNDGTNTGSNPSQPAEPRAGIGVRAALGVIVLYFGSSLPAYKIAGDSFGPATTNLIRFIVAAGALVFVARKHIPASRAVRWRLMRIGMLGLGLMAVLMAVGVDEGSAIIASVIVGLEPIGVAIAGLLLAGDRLTARPAIALVIGFTGALVASGLFTERSGPSPVVPVLLLLGTVATFSIYTANVRKASEGVNPLATAAMTQVGALVFVVPACIFDLLHRNDVTADLPGLLEPFRGMVRGDIQAKSLIAALLLGVGSAASYLLLCLVLANQPTNRVAVALYLTPVVGVLVSWLIVDEALHWRDLVGGALVLVAVAVSEWRTKVPVTLEGPG